jgi:ABC-type proline/glycine betaine transport system permease subunit
MICTTNNPAARRFFLRFLATMLVYAVCIVIAVWSFVHNHPTGVLAYLLAVLPALPIVAMLALFGLYLSEEKDEFQRAIFTESMLWGTGATLAATTVWGFLENFVHVPHLQLFLVFPLYCFFWGISSSLVQLRYK